MDFVYQSTINEEQADCKDIINLFFAADKYDMEHLRKACLVFIKENVSEDNAEEVLRFAMMIRHVKIIKEAALKIRE